MGRQVPALAGRDGVDTFPMAITSHWSSALQDQVSKNHHLTHSHARFLGTSRDLIRDPALALEPSVPLAYQALRQSCPKDRFHPKAHSLFSPGKIPSCLVQPKRGAQGNKQAQKIRSSLRFSSDPGGEGRLASQRRPRVSSWPQMGLRPVSVFMKCLSNKVSVLRS